MGIVEVWKKVIQFGPAIYSYRIKSVSNSLDQTVYAKDLMFCRKCQPILSDWRLYKMLSYDMNYNHDSPSYNNSLLEINNFMQ